MKISGAKIVVETLIEQGCDTIFGYPGGQVIDLFDELYNARDRIKHILTAHEQGAAHAADGYARSTGKVGVVIATSGPGATNLVTGIATAYLDSVPMVAITGNVSCDQIGRDSFQEVDIVGITMPITKHNFIVKDINELADTLRTAFKIAKSGRQGPVLVDIPKDVQTALCEYESNAQPVIPYPLTFASEEKLQKAAELINSAQRPYIYFGGGVISGKASQQVTALADKIDAPMSSSLMGLSAVPHDHPRFLGMQGMHGHFASTVAEYEADLVIALGVRFSNRSTSENSRFTKSFSIIHIDIDGAELNKNIPADLSIRGDLRDSVERLIAMVEEKKHPEWEKRIAELRAEEKTRTESAMASAREKTAAKGGSPKLSPYEIIDIISARAGDDVIIATDVGQHQMWTAQRYPLKKPRTFLSSGGLGAMGYGLGAAIGASTATGKRVVLFTGDGSFGMNLGELATAVSQDIPVVIVVMNNGVLGMVRQQQTLFYDKHYSNTTLDRRTDFAKVAESFGAKGGHASTAEELKALADEAFGSKSPFVIDCAVDCDELVLPILPTGGTADDIITAVK
ncbi:MAG: biosynthetic-type acetolactate synthase large subunit [Ruminococcus sp.]|uniref:biosynthetic-type acetolactate synthase large subunit n=1 Tax=Ruminococcus flavefaciens TaxID=1265 RepID=UPI0013DCABB6|nr:biosynthetic-type acetolactate synthase large subunit [Ruminococcus flavefaciens]MBQ6033883.1 biosynthetic-type acetolactate synthase large subunit [Ruminococcus sp.]